MAKYAKTGRFLKEDYPKSPEWLDNFIKLLNRFKDQAEQLFDKKLTVTDNMQGGIYDLELDTTGAVSNVIPASFKFTQGKPRAVLCGGCLDVTEQIVSVNTPTFGWSYDTDRITIDSISGLSPDKKYRLTFIVFVN